jgi:SAM-dependent methyltransferase
MPRRVKELAKAIVRCPICSGELVWGGSLACRSCGESYRRDGDVPILLVPADDTPAPPEGWYPSALRALPQRLQDVASRFAPRLRPTLIYKSRGASGEVERFVASLGGDAVVLNIGSGDSAYGPSVVNVDIAPFQNVDVVGTAERLPIAQGACDGAILMAVLEHVPDDELALSEARRVLKPGGLLFIDVPFIQAFHPSPHDYRRYTEFGLRQAVERIGFEVEASGVAAGPGSAAAWIGSEFLALLLSGRSARLYRILHPLTGWLLSWVRYSDAWLERHPMAYTVASAVWVRARRTDEAEKRGPPVGRRL